MAFKEYWEEAEKQGIEREAIEEVKREILETLRKEGFLDEEIDEMKMGKVWNFFLDSYATTFERYITEISLGLEKKPELTPIILPHVKKLNQMLKKEIKELEEKLEEEKRKKENSS